MKRFIAAIQALEALSVITVSAAILWTVFSIRAHSQPDATIERPGPMIENVDNAGLVLNLRISSDQAGRHGGDLALVEFSDFQCPFSGAFARTGLKDIRRDYVDSGKLTYVFMNFPLERIHPHAFRAAVASQCARKQGQFWPLHDAMFDNQRALVADNLLRIAEGIIDDTTSFQKCLGDEDTIQEVRMQAKEGARLGVSGTPTFFLGTIDDSRQLVIHRRIVGVATYDSFKKAVDELVRQRPRT